MFNLVSVTWNSKKGESTNLTLNLKTNFYQDKEIELKKKKSSQLITRTEELPTLIAIPVLTAIEPNDRDICKIDGTQMV